MGLWSSVNTEFRNVVATGPTNDSMPWVIGCLRKGKLVTAPPNYAKLVDTMATLRVKYGGLFLIRRNDSFCEWRSHVNIGNERIKYILMLPTLGDWVEMIYESKQQGQDSVYKQAVWELGHQIGSPMIDLEGTP
jgi:hypothetical protein